MRYFNPSKRISAILRCQANGTIILAIRERGESTVPVVFYSTRSMRSPLRKLAMIMQGVVEHIKGLNK